VTYLTHLSPFNLSPLPVVQCRFKLNADATKARLTVAEPKHEEQKSNEPFERFQDLTKKLLSVPKKEADEKRREEGRRKRPD
jgi:hypothetical protein